MSAREWIERTFPMSGDQVIIADAGDFQRYALSGVNPSVMPTSAISVGIDDFVCWFGSAIDAALSSGSSMYDALTDGTVQSRGWRPYFELWKAKGIIR